MNYINLINNFWNKAENSDLTGLDISVYMALLKYCNRLSWLNPFVCHWDIVCQTSKVSKNAYYKSIERLHFLGFIEYTQGKKNTNIKPKIFILELENKEGIIKEQQGNKEGIEKEQQGNLYKLLNIETIKLLNKESVLINEKLNDWIIAEKKERKKVPPKKEITLPSGFLEIWELWLDYRKAKKIKDYAGDKFEQMAIDKLVKLSNNNPTTAKEIITESITNSWTGFFELKNKPNNGTEVKYNRNR